MGGQASSHLPALPPPQDVQGRRPYAEMSVFFVGATLAVARRLGSYNQGARPQPCAFRFPRITILHSRSYCRMSSIRSRPICSDRPGLAFSRKRYSPSLCTQAAGSSHGSLRRYAYRPCMYPIPGNRDRSHPRLPLPCLLAATASSVRLLLCTRSASSAP